MPGTRDHGGKERHRGVGGLNTEQAAAQHESPVVQNIRWQCDALGECEIEAGTREKFRNGIAQPYRVGIRMNNVNAMLDQKIQRQQALQPKVAA